MIKILPYFIALLLLPLCMRAQARMEMEANTRQIEIGEPVELTITLYGSPPAGKPAVADTIGPFEILQTITADDGNKAKPGETSFKYIITAYLAGNLRIPSVALEGNPAVASGYIDILVKEPPADSLSSYKPLKEIMHLYETPQWPYWLGGGLLLLMALLGLWWWLRKRKKPAQSVKKSFHPQSALQQIGLLKQQWISKQITAIELGEGLMYTLCLYANVPPGQTSETMLKYLRQSGATLEADTPENLLNELDAWRFGKQQPALEKGTGIIEQVEKIVTQKDQPVEGYQHA